MTKPVFQNESLTATVERYLLHCSNVKRLNAATIKAYKMDFQHFIKFLSDKGRNNIESIDKKIVAEYIGCIEAMCGSAAVASMRRRYASVRAFIGYLESEKIIAISPLNKFAAKKPTARPAKFLTILEIEAMLSYLHTQEATDLRVRNLAIFELVFHGLKNFQLCNLKLTDVDYVSGIITVAGKKIRIANADARNAIKDYAVVRGVSDTDYFFVNVGGRKLQDQSVRYFIERIGKIVLNKHITPKMLRASFAAERERALRFINPRDSIQICKDVKTSLQNNRSVKVWES
ncbi:MAG: site-specific integrase [Firmicutes bacterium]|nr:site-specific integrase [Bacillota bacterium]